MPKILIVPDVHAPYHDDRAFRVMLEVAKDFKPDTVVVLGDLLDCYTVSAHSKDPRRKLRLQDEAAEARVLLGQLKALGARCNIFIEGNHEDRLDRYMRERAPELYGVVSIAELLNLKKEGWQHYGYGQHVRLGKLYCLHDAGFFGKYATHATASAFQGNAVFGHSHRLGAVYSGTMRGDHHVCVNAGWLGDVTKADYMHQSEQRDWQLGFALAHVSMRGDVAVQPIPIVHYSACYNGIFFEPSKSNGRNA